MPLDSTRVRKRIVDLAVKHLGDSAAGIQDDQSLDSFMPVVCGGNCCGRSGGITLGTRCECYAPVEFIMDLERAYDMDISDTDAEILVRGKFGDLVKYVVNQFSD
jgi:hypothetical protein